MQQLVAFAAALVALRLAGKLAVRWRARRAAELLVWSGALISYAVACAALAWGAAAGWDGRVFRVYYLFGALLTAPLLGAGSLLRSGRRWTTPVVCVYAGIAIGVVLALTLTRPVHGSAIPSAQAHLDFFPARVLALIGNSLGTIAVVAIALMTFRSRPLGNALLLLGVVVAAVGSALTGLGEAGTSAIFAIAVVLLYAGFVAPRSLQSPRSLLTLRSGTRLTD